MSHPNTASLAVIICLVFASHLLLCFLGCSAALLHQSCIRTCHAKFHENFSLVLDVVEGIAKQPQTLATELTGKAKPSHLHVLPVPHGRCLEELHLRNCVIAGFPTAAPSPSTTPSSTTSCRLALGAGALSTKRLPLSLTCLQ